MAIILLGIAMGFYSDKNFVFLVVPLILFNRHVCLE